MEVGCQESVPDASSIPIPSRQTHDYSVTKGRQGRPRQPTCSHQAHTAPEQMARLPRAEAHRGWADGGVEAADLPMTVVFRVLQPAVQEDGGLVGRYAGAQRRQASVVVMLPRRVRGFCCVTARDRWASLVGHALPNLGRETSARPFAEPLHFLASSAPLSSHHRYQRAALDTGPGGRRRMPASYR